MCKTLCEARGDGEMESCQNCGILICFDIERADDVIDRAYVTTSGDLYCRRCGRRHDYEEEESV